MSLKEQHVSGFSPDGKLFALSNDQCFLRVWHTDTNELKQEWIPVSSLAETAANNLKKQRKSTNVEAVTETKRKRTSIDMPMKLRLQNSDLIQPQSKVRLLVKSLRKKDAALLRSVICTSDIKTIELTLLDLPFQHIKTLANELTSLMRKENGNNLEFGLQWMKILIDKLMDLGSDNLKKKFDPIFEMAKSRHNCLSEYSKLTADMKLLVGQINCKKIKQENNRNTDNVLVYEDNDDSSNSDNKSSSDDE